MRSYLEVPLRVEGGAVIGSYCVVHTEPRDFSQLDIQTLDEIGTCIVDHLNLLRIKQKHDRAQQLIQGLGTIVAGSLDRPKWTGRHDVGQLGNPWLRGGRATSAIDAEPWLQRSLEAHDHAATVIHRLYSLASEINEAGVDKPREDEPRASDVNNLEQSLEGLRVDDSPPTDSWRQMPASPLSAVASPRLGSAADILPEQDPGSGEDDCDIDSDEYMLADITKLIFRHNDIDGVLILDAQVEASFADAPYMDPPSRRKSTTGGPDVLEKEDPTVPPLFCKEVGVRLRPTEMHTATDIERQSRQLSSTILHELLRRYPAGAIMRREKDAPVLDRRMQSRGPFEPATDSESHAANEKELFFEYLEGPLQIILAPMWAASHRNGPLCTVCWTRDRVRSFEDEDLALISAFCNSAVANLARKDAISTMQTKSNFMESISHELRSPIHYTGQRRST